MIGDQAFVDRLRTAMAKCRTVDQYRSLFMRAGVDAVVFDNRTPTDVCVQVQRICAETRDRVEGMRS